VFPVVNPLSFPIGRPSNHIAFVLLYSCGKHNKTQNKCRQNLAHFEHDEWTENAAKKIYPQIEAEYDSTKPEGWPIFIEVEPWFKEKTSITLRDISFENGNAFLGLQVMGYDLSMGRRIVSLLKRRDGKFVEENMGESGGRGRVKLEIVTPPDEAIITDDLEPNQGGSIAEMANMELATRNPGREIIETIEPIEGQSSQDHFSETLSPAFSTGEPQGTGGTIGLASIHTPHV